MLDEVKRHDETVNEFADRLFSSAIGFAYFTKEVYEAERTHHLVHPMPKLVALCFAAHENLLVTMKPQDWDEARGMSNRAVSQLAVAYLKQRTTVSILLDQNEEILARERLTKDFEIYTTLIVHRVNEVTSLEQLVQRLIGVVLTHKARIEKK